MNYAHAFGQKNIYKYKFYLYINANATHKQIEINFY
jgi:hypothetical protein